MPRADLSRITLRKLREQAGTPANWGVTPAAALRTLNIVTENLQGQVERKRSQTAKSNRLPGPTRRTYQFSSGPVEVELTYGAQLQEFLEDALCETTSADYGVAASTEVSFAAADNSINDESVGADLFDGIFAGNWIRVAGAVASSGANNGLAYVASKPSATKLIVAYRVLTIEAAGPPITIDGRFVRDGVKLISSTFERDHEDFTTDRYRAYPGEVCQSMELTFQFEEIMRGTFNYEGKWPLDPAAASVGTGAPLAAEDIQDTLADVSNNMRLFREGGLIDGNIMQLTVSLQNNNELIRLAQGLEPVGVSMGVAGLTGRLEGHFIDADGRVDRVFGDTPTSYHFEIEDDAGNVLVPTIFRARMGGAADATKSAASGPAPLNVDWEAEEDPTVEHWIQFCFFDAP